MRVLIGLFFTLFFTAFMVTGGIWALFKMFSGLGGPLSGKATDNLVKRLRGFLKETKDRLVPWEPEMLTLLSLNQQDIRKPGLWGRPLSGTFTTIFQEPVLTYALQQSGNAGLMVAQTSDREFVFRRKDQQTEIWVNGQPLGIFAGGKLQAAGDKRQILAGYALDPVERQFPVTIDQKMVATVTNPALREGPNPRAITLMQDLEGGTENTVLALAILEMTGWGKR